MFTSILLAAALTFAGAGADAEPRGMAEADVLWVVDGDERYFVADATHLPPCETEDADGPCYWDADARGNGEGVSFYVLGGEVTYLG